MTVEDAIERLARVRLWLPSVVALISLSSASDASASPGDFDPTFSGDGIVFGQDFTGAAGLPTIGPTPENDVVFADGNSLQKVDSSGRIDASFEASAREALAPFGPTLGLYDLVVDSASRAVILVSTVDNPSAQIGQSYLIRLRSDGALDTSFGSSGVAPLTDAIGGSIAVDGAGRVFAGSGSTVFHFDAGGQPDMAFSGGSVAVASSVRSVAFASSGDGLLVLSDSSLTRLRTDGTIDTSFGGNGSGSVVAAAGGCCAGDVSVGDSGRIVVQYSRCLTGAGCSGGLFEVNPDGSPVEGFRGGLTSRDSAAPNSIAIDNDMRLYVAHPAGFAKRPDAFALNGMSANGSKRRSFGIAGLVLAYPDGCAARAEALSLDNRSRPVVLGVACDRTFVVRLKARGGPDDIDADGFSDRIDRCNLVYGSRHRGCPKRSRRLALDKTGDRVLVGHLSLDAGRLGRRGVSSTCISRQVVELVSTGADGHKKVVDTARTTSNGAWKLRRRGTTRPERVVAHQSFSTVAFCRKTSIAVP